MFCDSGIMGGLRTSGPPLPDATIHTGFKLKWEETTMERTRRRLSLSLSYSLFFFITTVLFFFSSLPRECHLLATLPGRSRRPKKKWNWYNVQEPLLDLITLPNVYIHILFIQHIVLWSRGDSLR